MKLVAWLGLAITIFNAIIIAVVPDKSYIITSITTLLFTLFLIFFTTVFLELWKREEGKYRHIWGLTDYTED